MKINVNGQEYESWDDVPDDIRQLLAKSGVDLETAAKGHVEKQVTEITVDGVTYSSPDDVPPQARAALEAAGLLGRPAPGANGMPRFAAAAPPPGGRTVIGPDGQVLLTRGPKRKGWLRRG